MQRCSNYAMNNHGNRDENSLYGKVFKYLDCERRVHFTSVSNGDMIYSYNSQDCKRYFSMQSFNGRSFLILSKARSDNIDYVTYVFGA